MPVAVPLVVKTWSNCPLSTEAASGGDAGQRRHVLLDGADVGDEPGN